MYLLYSFIISYKYSMTSKVVTMKFLHLYDVSILRVFN